MTTLLQGLYVLHARLQPSLGSTQTIVSGEGSEAKSGSSPITSSSHTAETSTQDDMGLNALLPTPRATLRPLLCYNAPEGETTLYTPSPTTLQDEGVGSPDAKGEQTTSSTACDVLNGKEAMQGLLECFTGELLWLQARQLHAKHQHEKFARREAKAQQQTATTTSSTSSSMTAEEGQTRLSWQCLPIAENGLYLQTPTTGYVHHCHRSYQQQQQNTKASQQALHSSRALQSHLRHTGALPYMDTVSYYAEHAAQPARNDTSNGEGYDYGYAFFLDATACGLSGQSVDGQTQVTSNSEHNSNVTIAESTRWAQQSEGILLCLTAASPAFNFLRSLTLELLPVLVRALHEVRHVRQPTAQSIIQEMYSKVFDEWAIWLSQLLDERLSQTVRGLVQASHAIQRRLPGEILGLQLPSYSQQQTGQVNAMHAGSPAQGRLQGSMLRRPLNLLYPYLDTPLAILLASFPYAALRVLHTLLLQEQRVLVLGVSAQHAAACVVATQALLTPLTYCGTLIPYLPAIHATSCGLLDTLLLSTTTTVDDVASSGFVVGTTAELVPHVLLRLNAFISTSNAASRCQPLTSIYIADARTGHVGPVPCETLRAILQESDESGTLYTSPSSSHALRFTCDVTRLRKLQDTLTQSSTSLLNTTCELALLPHEDKLKAALKKVMKREQRLAFRALIELLARRTRQRAQVLQDVEAGCRVRRARRRALRHRRTQPRTPAGNVSFHTIRHAAPLSTPITSSSGIAGNAEDETDEVLSEALSLEAADVVSHDGTEWNDTMQAVSPREGVAQVHEDTKQQQQQGWTGTTTSSEEQGAMGMFSSSLSSSSSSSSAASSASLSDDEGQQHVQQRVASPSGGLDNMSSHKSLQAADKAQRAAMASAMQRIGQLTEAPICPIDESATLESMHAALLQYNVQWVIGNYRARLQPNTSTSSYNATRDVVVAGTSMSLSSSSRSLYAGNDAGQKDLQYYLTGPADGVDSNINNNSTLSTSGITASPPSLQRAMRLVSRSHSYRQFMASVWCAETLGLRGVLRGAFLDTPSNSNSNTSHEPQHKIGAAGNIYVRHPRMLLLLSAFYGRAMTLFPSYYGDLAGFSLLRTNCGLVQSLTSHNTTSSSTSSSSAREAMTRISELLFTMGGEGSNNNSSTTTTTVNALNEGGAKYASGKVKTHKGMKGILHKAKKMVKKLGATGKGRHHHGITVRMDGFVQTLGNTNAGLQPALAERHITAVVSIGNIAYRVARSPLHGSPNITLPAMSSSTPTSPEYLHGTQRVMSSNGVGGVTCRVSRLNELLSENNSSTSNHRDKATVARAPLLLCRPLPLDVVHQFASYHRLLDPRHATIYTQYYNTTTTSNSNDVVVDDKGQVSALVTSATQREVQRDDCAQRGSGESYVRQIMAQATLYRTLGFLCPTCVPMWRRAEQLRLAALLVQEEHQKEAAMVTPFSRPFITKVEDTVFTPTTTSTKMKETDKKNVEDKHTTVTVKQPATTSPHTAFFPVSLDELWSQGWPTSPQPTTTNTTTCQPFVPVVAAHQDSTEGVVERRESMSPVMQRVTLMPQGEDVSTQPLVPQRQHVDAFGSDWGAFTSGVPEGYIAPTEVAGTTQIMHSTSPPAGGATSVNTTTWWTPGNNVMTPVTNATTTAGGNNTVTSHARPASPHDLLDELFGPSPHA